MLKLWQSFTAGLAALGVITSGVLIVLLVTVALGLWLVSLALGIGSLIIGVNHHYESCIDKFEGELNHLVFFEKPFRKGFFTPHQRRRLRRVLEELLQLNCDRNFVLLHHLVEDLWKHNSCLLGALRDLINKRL